MLTDNIGVPVQVHGPGHRALGCQATPRPGMMSSAVGLAGLGGQALSNLWDEIAAAAPSTAAQLARNRRQWRGID